MSFSRPSQMDFATSGNREMAKIMAPNFLRSTQGKDFDAFYVHTSDSNASTAAFLAVNDTVVNGVEVKAGQTVELTFGYHVIDNARILSQAEVSHFDPNNYVVTNVTELKTNVPNAPIVLTYSQPTYTAQYRD